jgi:hypothetical protein
MLRRQFTTQAMFAGLGWALASLPARADLEVPIEPFLPLPGWLGFATVVGKKPTRFTWSPRHPKAQIVIPDQEQFWLKSSAGAKLIAIDSAGSTNMSFLNFSEQRYGCEGNTMGMAGFSGTRTFQEGPVWLLPGDSTARVFSVPITEKSTGKPQASVRSWKIGSYNLTLRKTDTYAVKLDTTFGSRTLLSEPLRVFDIAGAENQPVNLPKLFAPGSLQPGIPRPIAAFQMGFGAPLAIILWIPGFEGNDFQLLLAESTQAHRIDAAYFYSCAF